MDVVGMPKSFRTGSSHEQEVLERNEMWVLDI
jgi:hypothetical protein